MPAGRPKKWTDVETLQKLIDKYFDEMIEQERPLTITGLAIALGTSRDILLDYQKDEKFSNTIKNAKLIIHNYAEEYLFTGRNTAGCIFNLKNNWAWKDKTEQELTGANGGPMETKWIVELVDAPKRLPDERSDERSDE